MSSYFNVDWLDEDRLDLSEDLLLDESGNPIGDINLQEMMADYIITGDGVMDISREMELDTLGHANLYTLSDAEGMPDEGEQFTGLEAWERSGAAGVLNQKRDYNKWKELNNKKTTIADISKSLNEIESIKRLGEMKTKEIQKLAGKSGFAGSGQHHSMQEAHYGDVSRTVQGVTGKIKKNILGYTSDINKSREKYIEDTWNLYSDWLKTDPEQYEKFTCEGRQVFNPETMSCEDPPPKGTANPPQVNTSEYGLNLPDTEGTQLGEFISDYEDVILDMAGEYGTLSDAMIGMGELTGGLGLSGFEDQVFQQQVQNEICAAYPDLAGCGGALTEQDHLEIWDCPTEVCDTWGNPCGWNPVSGHYTNNQGEICYG